MRLVIALTALLVLAACSLAIEGRLGTLDPARVSSPCPGAE